MKNKCLIFLFCFASMSIYAQDLYFPPNFSEEWETVSLSDLDWCAENEDNFTTFLDETNTKACIILKDGKMAHESYYDDFDMTKIWYWASAGKSLTAGMIGILQDEGLLQIEDLTSAHLGEGWTSCDLDAEQKITLRHQLTMTSGLDYTLNDIYCIDPECLFCLNEPGEEWFYHNAPYTLLSDVIESVTDEGYTAATNSRLVNKIGFIGLWTKVGTGRLFWSTARGMARYGLLMLNNGDWGDEVILNDKNYLQDMITTSQEINKSYGYLWWLNGKESHRLPGTTITFPGSIIPNAPDDLYAAIGKDGQILIVVPSQNLVIVRMGENPDNSLVPVGFIRDLWDEYVKLSCDVSAADIGRFEFSIRPKLVWNRLKITTDQEIDNVSVFDLKGNKVYSSKDKVLELGDLARGIYFIQVSQGSRSSTQKFVKI